MQEKVKTTDSTSLRPWLPASAVKRVAFFGATVLEHGGGLEKYFMDTSKQLSENYPLSVDIITLDENFSFKILKLLSFYNIKKYDRSVLRKISTDDIKESIKPVNYKNCKNFSELRKELSNYDLIYSKNELLEAFIFKFFVGYKGLPPIIFGCHTSLRYPFAASIKHKVRNFLYGSFIYKYLASGISAFQVLNSYDESVAKSLFPHKKVFRIFNPFSFEKYYENEKTCKQPYGFENNGTKKILWIGNFHEIKGIKELANIIKNINEIDGYIQKITWLIAGGGQDIDIVESLAKTYPNIVYIGYVNNKYIPDLINKTDLLINTSKVESFGFTTIEANALGKPMFSFSTSGHKDLIKENVNGKIMSNIDAYIEALKLFVDDKIKFDENDIKIYIKSKMDSHIIYNEIYSMFNVVMKENII